MENLVWIGLLVGGMFFLHRMGLGCCGGHGGKGHENHKGHDAPSEGEPLPQVTDGGQAPEVQRKPSCH